MFSACSVLGACFVAAKCHKHPRLITSFYGIIVNYAQRAGSLWNPDKCTEFSFPCGTDLISLNPDVSGQLAITLLEPTCSIVQEDADTR